MIDDLIADNVRAAAARARSDPERALRLQTPWRPERLWIGCSEGLAASEDVAGIDPATLIVHRNLANLAPACDMAFLAAMEHAVEVARVRTIVVCGHYGCAGVREALRGERHCLADHWLQPVRGLARAHAGMLAHIQDEDARVNDLCERNVAAQVAEVAANPIVQEAWRRGQPLSVHGVIWSARDGLLRDLEISCSDRRDVETVRDVAWTARLRRHDRSRKTSGTRPRG